jgi:hypothetical protein
VSHWRFVLNVFVQPFTQVVVRLTIENRLTRFPHHQRQARRAQAAKIFFALKRFERRGVFSLRPNRQHPKISPWIKQMIVRELRSTVRLPLPEGIAQMRDPTVLKSNLHISVIDAA